MKILPVVVQRAKLPPAALAFHIGVQTGVLVALLPTPLPATAPGQAAANGPSVGFPAPKIKDPDGTFGSWLSSEPALTFVATWEE